MSWNEKSCYVQSFNTSKAILKGKRYTYPSGNISTGHSSCYADISRTHRRHLIYWIWVPESGKLHHTILFLLWFHVSFDSMAEGHSLLMSNLVAWIKLVTWSRIVLDYWGTMGWRSPGGLIQHIWRNGWKLLMHTRLMQNLGVIMSSVCSLFYHLVSAKSNVLYR